jgi:hypothetical protein
VRPPGSRATARVRLTAIVLSQTSSGVLRKGIFSSMPALLTIMSRRPNSSTAFRIRFFTSSGFETSAWTEIALLPEPWILSTTSFASSGLLL